jgi:predicted O-methyltransferase YrrM
MSRTSIGVTPALRDYLLAHAQELPLLGKLRRETASLPEARMQISPEQGRFMAWLVGVRGVRTALEVGVFTGYSSLCAALALPEDGSLVACDVNERWTSIARRYWSEAQVDAKIDLRLAPAEQTLNALLSEGRRESFDFAFIDADKSAYDRYYELSLELLRPGGLLLFDNALWHGAVADSSRNDADTVAIRQLNAKAVADERVSAALVPVGDGLLLVRRL